MKKRVISLLIFLIIIFFNTAEIFSKEKFSIETFGKFMKSSMKSWNVPGVAVGVIDKGYIILARGYGYRNVEKKLPVTRKTLFAIGSATKAFTSFMLGQLVDEGKLEWNKPVRTYLPDFTLYDEYTSNHMRVIDLLIHNSGLPRHDIVWYGSDVSRKELYHGLKYLKNNREFGTTFQYQNLMYMTAGYLLGKLCGSSWEDQIGRRIFKPLDMTATNLSVKTSQKSENYSLPYKVDSGKIVKIPFYKRIGGIAPAGAVNSNIDDMLSWMKLLLDKGKREGKKFVSENTLTQILSPHMIAGGTIAAVFNRFPEFSYPTYGMGWFINHYRGHNLIHHGGNIDGFSALVSFMPDMESGVIVLTNNSGNFLTYSAALMVYDGLMGKKPLPWNERFLKLFKSGKEKNDKEKIDKEKKRVKGTLPSHKLKEFAGRYENPAYGVFTVLSGESGLKFKYHKFEGELSHYHYDFFKIENTIFSGTKIHFLTNPKGDICKLSVPFEPAVDDIEFKRMISSFLTEKNYLKEFTGSFRFTAGNLTAKIFLKGENKLFLQATGQPEFRLDPYKKNIFNLKGLKGFSIEFVRNKSGKVISFISHQPNGSFTAKKVESK